MSKTEDVLRGYVDKGWSWPGTYKNSQYTETPWVGEESHLPPSKIRQYADLHLPGLHGLEIRYNRKQARGEY